MSRTSLRIIDSTSPFFERHPDRQINWSKIPFYTIEKDGIIRKKNRKRIKKNFSSYLKRVQAIGYNAISLDELPYLVDFPFYPRALKTKTAHYRRYFSKLISAAVEDGMRVFITSDVSFTNAAIQKYTGDSFDAKIKLFRAALIRLFILLPGVSGVILRIGESDGVDVQGDFLSELLIKTPKEGNQFLKTIMPVFIQFNKTCIFRTWSVGAHKIGDLIWNPVTYNRLFRGVGNSHLIVSLKYGDSDFFRYLPLNRHIQNSGQRKIVEFQTRREYEGFGEFPAYIGWEYRKYMRRLRDCPGIEGISVWCSTGGWSTFRNFTFLKNSSPWNELNTYAAIQLYMKMKKPKSLILSFFGEKMPGMPKYLKSANLVINTILYDPGFAGRNLFFNRSRIPPLLHVFWNNITVNNFIITFYSTFRDKEKSIKSLEKGKEALEICKDLNNKHSLDQGFHFFYDTFIILYWIRKMMHLRNREPVLRIIDEKIAEYKKTYPDTYSFSINCKPREQHSRILNALLRTVIRSKPEYRYLDRILFNPVTSRLYYLLYLLYKKSFPGFTGKQAMSIKTLLS